MLGWGEMDAGGRQGSWVSLWFPSGNCSVLRKTICLAPAPGIKEWLGCPPKAVTALSSLWLPVSSHSLPAELKYSFHKDFTRRFLLWGQKIHVWLSQVEMKAWNPSQVWFGWTSAVPGIWWWTVIPRIRELSLKEKTSKLVCPTLIMWHHLWPLLIFQRKIPLHQFYNCFLETNLFLGYVFAAGWVIAYPMVKPQFRAATGSFYFERGLSHLLGFAFISHVLFYPPFHWNFPVRCWI